VFLEQGTLQANRRKEQAMDYYTFTVKLDKRWPADEDGDLPLIAFGNWAKFAGWWKRSHFEEWLQQRGGSIVEENAETGEMKVLAQLTRMEVKKGFRKCLT